MSDVSVQMIVSKGSCLHVSCHETYLFKSAFQFKYDIKAPTLTMSEKSIGHVDPSYALSHSEGGTFTSAQQL